MRPQTQHALLAFAVATFLPALAQAAPTVSKLPNGLTVVLEEDHRSPKVGMVISYAVGAEHDPQGKRGQAAVMAKLMGSPSTRHVGRKDFGPLWDALGTKPLVPAVDLRMDRTFLTHDLPSNKLELAMWIESDRMGFLLDGLDTGSLASARELVEHDRQREEVHTSYGGVQAIIRRSLFPETHPYSEWVLGRGSEIMSVSLTDARDAWKKRYAPNRATLVLVGDFEEAQAKTMIEKYFGPIPAAEGTLALPQGDRPTLTGEKTLKVEANVRADRAVITWSTPPLFDAGDADLDLFAQVAANVPNAPLVSALVKSGIATQVGARQRSSRLASRFEIELDLESGTNPSNIPKLLDDLFSNMTFSQDDVINARARMLRESGFREETFRGRAQAIAADTFYGNGDPGFAKKNRKRYEDVTPESITKTVKSFLVQKGHLVVHVVKSTNAPAAGRVKGTSL